MYKIPLKGTPPKKQPKPLPDLETVYNLAKTQEELKKVKEDFTKVVEEKIREVDDKITEMDESMDSSKEVATEAIRTIKEQKNNAIEVIREIEAQKGRDGRDGEDGKDGKDADEEKIVEAVIARMPNPPIIDEKDLVTKILKKLPTKKGDLKIIQEQTDPMSVIEKILALAEEGKFKIKTSHIDGLENSVKAFWARYPKGYLHGGGDTVVAGTNISITTNSSGQKVIASTLPVLAGVTSLNGITGDITLVAGSGISLSPSGNTITISAAGGGTVTSVSVVSTNGFAGTVANATTTPAITLSTTITGLLKGNGTAISAAVAGTDYLTPTGSGTGLSGIPYTLTGTANQVILSAGTGNITFSLPQSIATSSTPTFASMTLTAASSLTLGTASSLAGSIIFKNATNANTLTFLTGVTSSSYTLTFPTAVGGANTFLKDVAGNGVLSWVSVTATAPGGSNKQVQYNNSSAFGGMSTMNFDNGTGYIGFGTKTSPAFPIDMAFSTTAGNAFALAVTQTSPNATDQGDTAQSLTYTLSASSATNELVVRVFSLIPVNSLTGGGVLTNMRCFNLTPNTIAATTTTNLDYIYIQANPASAGTVTTARGLYITSLYGTTLWGIQDSSAGNWALASKFIIGLADSTTLPSARLHIQEPTLNNEVIRHESVTTNTYPSERLFQGRGTTTNNTQTTIMTLAMPYTDAAYNIEVEIIMTRTGGSSGSAGDSYYAFYRTGARSISSSLSGISGVGFPISPNESGSNVMVNTPSSVIDASSNSLLVKVTGNTNVNYTWHVHVWLRPVVS